MSLISDGLSGSNSFALSYAPRPHSSGPPTCQMIENLPHPVMPFVSNAPAMPIGPKICASEYVYLYHMGTPAATEFPDVSGFPIGTKGDRL